TPHPSPLIMIHGGVHTGTSWVTTPDGRPGWAPLFAAHGYNVYVVDWPGVGRAGCWPGSLTPGVRDGGDALLTLIARTGPAILVGHSIGGALAFKVAERAPEQVHAIVALAPASVESTNTAVPIAALDKPVTISRDAARQRFANSAKFPQEAFDTYF